MLCQLRSASLLDLCFPHSLRHKRAAADGFAGQYLVNIPLYATPTERPARPKFSDRLRAGFGPVLYKQLNLTAWASEKAAHDWYANNDDHWHVVTAHRTGMLSSFSCMLANLVPAKKVRWDARCSNCNLISPNYPDAKFCNTCGSKLTPIPLF